GAGGGVLPAAGGGSRAGRRRPGSGRSGPDRAGETAVGGLGARSNSRARSGRGGALVSPLRGAADRSAPRGAADRGADHREHQGSPGPSGEGTRNGCPDAPSTNRAGPGRGNQTVEGRRKTSGHGTLVVPARRGP